MIPKSFQEGIIERAASDGCQYVRTQFTVVNIGLEDATFLPMTSNSDIQIGIVDSQLEYI